ncbi:uncharacterized protein [Aristolochia californica]|uniref:uncharacterized protein isoform X1 n=1 Tax=Aristolochia californica TaxID=171875 RepID=UPI0035DBF4F2
MSFLAGRLASTEGAYFLQESKQAVVKLAQKLPPSTSTSKAVKLTDPSDGDKSDVLHEVLRHSLPPSTFSPPAASSLSTASRWVVAPPPISSAKASPDAINPLRAFTSLPQVTFGPKRWQFPTMGDHSISASTANELRHDMHSTVNSKNLEAAAQGLSQIGKAFAVASVVVFGGATVAFTVTASKLQLQSFFCGRLMTLKLKERACFNPSWRLPGSNWFLYMFGLKICQGSGMLNGLRVQKKSQPLSRRLKRYWVLGQTSDL